MLLLTTLGQDDFAGRADTGSRMADKLIEISEAYTEYLMHETVLPYYVATSVEAVKHMSRSFYQANRKVDQFLALGLRMEATLNGILNQIDFSQFNKLTGSLNQMNHNFNELAHIARSAHQEGPKQLQVNFDRGLSAINFETNRIVKLMEGFQDMLQRLSSQAAAGLGAASVQQNNQIRQLVSALQKSSDQQSQRSSEVLQTVARVQTQALSDVFQCATGDGTRVPISLNFSVPTPKPQVAAVPTSVGADLDLANIDLDSLDPSLLRSLDIATIAAFVNMDEKELMELIEPFGGIEGAIEAFGGPQEAFIALQAFSTGGAGSRKKRSSPAVAPAPKKSGRTDLHQMLRGLYKKQRRRWSVTTPPYRPWACVFFEISVTVL